MKKLILLFFVCFSLVAHAQKGDTLYFQDFENYHTGDMTMIDYDSLTPHFAGLQTWEIINGKAVSSSYIKNGNKTANDWMITPTITLSANPALMWDAYTSAPKYREGYQVLISTNVNNPSDTNSFHVLFTIGGENTAWTKHGLKLAQYANQKVRLAWRNNSTDKYLLFIDNIFVFNQKNNDIIITKTTRPFLSKTGDNLNFYINILNYGLDTLKSIKIGYQINDSTPVIETKTTNKAFGETETLSFSQKFKPLKDTIYNLKLWIAKPNGQTNQSNTKDTAYIKFSTWSEQGAQNKILIEHFTQASCGPCGQQNPALNSLLANNKGKYVHIAYHTSWPGYDPMYSFNREQSDSIVKYYGVNSVPDVIVNGTNNLGSPTNVTQGLIDQNYQKNSPIKININCIKKIDSVFISINLIPYAYFSQELNAKVIFTEDKNYSYSPGSNGEKFFPDVMIKMIPGLQGTTLPNLYPKDTIKLHLTYKLPEFNTVNFFKSKIAVFIQNNKTKEVFATDELVLDATNKISEKSNPKFLNIYPNPATDFITLNIPGHKAQKIEIYDSYGQLVIKKSINNISNFSINTTQLIEGIYFIKIFADNNILSSKFTITKK